MNKFMNRSVYDAFVRGHALSSADQTILKEYDFIYGGDVLTLTDLQQKKVTEIIQFRDDFGTEKMMIEIKKKIK